MEPVRLSVLASDLGLQLRGPDLEVTSMGTLATPSTRREQMLTYVTGPEWVGAFLASGGRACITTPQVAELLPTAVAALVTDESPADAFYAAFTDSVEAGRWTQLPSNVAPTASIAPSAVVHPGVQVGPRTMVMDHVVLLPNTRLGADVIVKPNATLGGDGFQVRNVGGRRRLVPHAGGVDVADGAVIGSSTCIDRGLFGESTTVGAGAMVDNLVHVAHSAVIGAGATVVACSEISGSATIGEGAWLGPNTSVNPGITVGDFAYLGTGSVVVRDIARHVLAYGSPARPGGYVCRCHAKLPPLDEDGRAHCGSCGTVVTV